MLSLRWKLGGALLLVVLISVGITAYLINQNTASQFQQYVQGGNMVYTQRIVNNLEQYYTQNKSWSGVEEILNAALRTNTDRLLLADNSGIIVADTANQLVGKSSNTLSVTGTSIPISGNKVGTLYTFLSETGTGKGYMGGRGMMGGSTTSTPTMVQNLENDFLNRINSYIWIAGIIAAVIAILLGLFLTRQMTRPIKALITGAKHISEGELSYRVNVRSGDEIGELAKSFNNMATKLDNSEQSRKRLVSDVAHELRTPLTIIEGTVDGILDGVFQPDQEHLGSIKEQTGLLTHLVNDLRDLSLAESGQLRLDRSSINLVDLIQRKAFQFTVKAEAKNIQLKVEASPDLPEIKVDPKRIEQVVSNLLSNSIRHTSESGHITISVKTVKSGLNFNKSGLLTAVNDTGEGIPVEHLPHLFERFYRVENSRARSEGGAGLGLAIVKQMVEAHGGQVWAESERGKGSTFYFFLPME